LGGSSFQLKKRKKSFYGFYGSFTVNHFNFFGNWPGYFDRAFHKITATDCDAVRRSWIFDAGIKRKDAKGKRRKERPDLPWAEEIVRGTPKAFGEGMGTTDSFRLIPLPIIPLPSQFGATQGAHWWILAQWAESVQLMVEIFFVMRNPCKH
jgi:hypothetical protein